MSAVNGFDTEKEIYFYEPDYYVFSNFSAFEVFWPQNDCWFKTAEHMYHYMKFNPHQEASRNVAIAIARAHSAHDAFKIAQENKHLRRSDWDSIKLDVMRDVIRLKTEQHSYVHKKLMDSVGRRLVENSWRDDYWGWGPNKDGKNMLGVLWMELRDNLLNPVMVNDNFDDDGGGD